jgi:hypothetical protein
MRKIIFLLTLSLGFTFSSFAQSTKTGDFNVGIYGALPLYNMRSIFNEGFGASIKYEYYWQKNLNFTLEGGYEAFGVKTKLQNPVDPSTIGYVPLKLGIKAYLSKGFYAEGQLGAVFYCQHGGGDAFDSSCGIGYSFKKGFEMGLRYEQWNQTPQNNIGYVKAGPFIETSNFGQVALRLAEWF